MSVRENLDMGAFIRRDAAGQREDMDRIMELFPILKERARQAAGTLGRRAADAGHGPGADGPPKLLLLDEPSMGLAPLVVQTIFDTIRDINSQGMTVLLVEQNAAQALSLANRGYVIETGKIVLEDDVAGALLENEQVRKAWARSSAGPPLRSGEGRDRWLRSRTFPECARSLLGPRTPAPDGPRGPRGDPDCGHANSRACRGSTDRSLCGNGFSIVAGATCDDGLRAPHGFLDPDEILARAV